MSFVIVVTPVYEDTEAAGILFREIAKINCVKICVVAVDDGSVKNPLPIESIRSAGLGGHIVRLHRNVGHQNAIAIGLSWVKENIPAADFVVSMDSDGEDLPASIPLLLEKIQSGQVDVVVSSRKSRVETLKFKAFYLVYKFLFKLFTGRKISFGNFMILNPAALDRLVHMQELKTHVAACVLASKLRVAELPMDRGPRYAGKSKMNFAGLALHGFKAFMVFAEDVLVRVGMICVGLLAVTILLAFAVLGLKLFGLSSPGWFSVALGILGILFLQLGSLALMALMNLMLTGMIKNNGHVQSFALQFVKEVVDA